MRNIVLMMSVSLDGFFESPERELGWQRVDEELHTHFNELLRTMDAFLDGRRTFELMADYWPTADADPDAPAPVAEFAGIWRGMPKIVYSRTLTEVGHDAVLKHAVVREEIEALKAEPGGDLALGGAELARSFLELGFVDEFRIYVHPVLLGRGRPLFAGAAGAEAAVLPAVPLELQQTRAFGNGVVLLHYRRAAGEGVAGS